MFRILTIDGGGIRGIIPAIWLQSLQKRVERPLYKCFDLIAGTSTGAVLAAITAFGLNIDEAINLYRDKGAKIFAPRSIKRDSGWLLPGFIKPKYDPKPLADELQKLFSTQKKLQEAETRLLITSYDVFNRRSFWLRSYDKDHLGVPVWEACMASCSAPVYFPAHVLHLGEAQLPLVDGGVVANNPAAVALAEAVRLQDAESLSETAKEI